MNSEQEKIFDMMRFNMARIMDGMEYLETEDVKVIIDRILAASTPMPTPEHEKRKSINEVYHEAGVDLPPELRPPESQDVEPQRINNATFDRSRDVNGGKQ